MLEELGLSTWVVFDFLLRGLPACAYRPWHICGAVGCIQQFEGPVIVIHFHTFINSNALACQMGIFTGHDLLHFCDRSL